MLSKKERLSRSDFKTFFSSGKRYHNQNFTLIYTPHRSFHGSVVVPSKVERKAVRRNKLRRRVYDILRRLSRLRKEGGVYIVLVKKQAVMLPYVELRTSLTSLLDKVQVTG